LSKGWTGPYRIMSLPSDVNCMIQLNPTAGAIRVHSDSLKPYKGPVPAVWIEFESSNSECESVLSSEQNSEPEGSEKAEDRSSAGEHAQTPVPPETSSPSSGSDGEDTDGEVVKVPPSPPSNDQVRRGNRQRKPPKKLDW
jgi:hypothetical protein